MSKPTPRPWCIGTNNKTIVEGSQPSQDWSKNIALFQDKEDAALALKCVNMHEDLVEMLRQCEAMLVLDGHAERNGQTETAFLRLVRAVLAKAEAK